MSALRNKRLKSQSQSHEAWHPRSTPTSGAGSGASRSVAYLESTRQDEKIDGWHVTGGGRTRPHAPLRALSMTAREGHAPDRKPNLLADVSLTQSHDPTQPLP